MVEPCKPLPYPNCFPACASGLNGVVLDGQVGHKPHRFCKNKVQKKMVSGFRMLLTKRAKVINTHIFLLQVAPRWKDVFPQMPYENPDSHLD